MLYPERMPGPHLWDEEPKVKQQAVANVAATVRAAVQSDLGPHPIYADRLLGALPHLGRDAPRSLATHRLPVVGHDLDPAQPQMGELAHDRHGADPEDLAEFQHAVRAATFQQGGEFLFLSIVEVAGGWDGE